MLRSSTPRPISAKVTCGPIVARQWLFGKRGSGSSPRYESSRPSVCSTRRLGGRRMDLTPLIPVVAIIAFAAVKIARMRVPRPESPSADVGYEHYRRSSSPRATALHAAGAVALGAFGLALVANVHWVLAETHGQRPPLLALPVWPVITAIPAFLGALAVAAVLTRFSRRVGK